MSFRSRIREMLTGLTVPQEYCCIEKETFEQPMRVTMTVRNRKLAANVTATHVFLGYKPVVVALPFNRNDHNDARVKGEEEICLTFSQGEFRPDAVWRGFPTSRSAVARLTLSRVAVKMISNNAVMIYIGDFGEHTFLGPIHQLINRQRERIRKYNPGNVGLPGNLFEQVRIAYSCPRQISTITVAERDRMNIFPTDLHGPVGNDWYLGSLRTGGLANEQVEQSGKIVLSNVAATWFKEAYALGKNHMREMRDVSSFPLHRSRTKTFSFPLPEAALNYRELRRTDSLDVGIHRIHFYEVADVGAIASGPSLAHVHQYYAQWRIDHGLPMSWFVR